MRSDCWDNVDYEITQGFQPGVHDGIDIGCPSGTIIKAARAGVVETVETGIVGIHVTDSAQRDFYVHGYSLVVVGQQVEVGTPVIHSDTVQADPRYPLTGPHLHFEVQNGFTLPGAPPYAEGHPLNPVPILEGVEPMSIPLFIDPSGAVYTVDAAGKRHVGPEEYQMYIDAGLAPSSPTGLAKMSVAAEAEIPASLGSHKHSLTINSSTGDVQP